MTVIVAYENNNEVWLGTDSCGICGDSKISIGSKIISRGNYYIGFEGSYRVADIIRESDKIPATINKRKDLEHLRDMIREELIKKTGASISDCSGEDNDTHPLSIIVISKLGIHEVQSDYAIIKPLEKFSALGAGKDFALGALETHRLYGADPETAVKESVRTSINHCIGCGGKIYTAKIFKKDLR